MNIGIIDADLIYKTKHRFPNLAAMKLSGWHKLRGDCVKLLLSYDDVVDYDKVYISKVFTDTKVPQTILTLPNVEYGGTGFFYDHAPKLPNEIEHHMPDYHLYDEWVNMQIKHGAKRDDFKYYLDYSIGFVTRGCFRQCEFCVNKNYTQCVQHSSVVEFMDTARPKICLLDDNFFACPQWKEIIEDIKSTGKRFQFKQGLDERLLTDEKIHELMSWKYDGEIIFAFDNIADKTLIEGKLSRITELYPNHKKQFKFYVLCGYDRSDKYDDAFWKLDIKNTFERIKILSKYAAIPYIMRHENYKQSKYRTMYITLARWCNQPSFLKKKTFREFCEMTQLQLKNQKVLCNTMTSMIQYAKDNPGVASVYYDMIWNDQRGNTTE